MNDQAEKMAIEYLNTRGVLPETFKAHGCEITGVDRDRVAQELNWNPNTRKSQKLGWAEAILHFPIFGPNGTGKTTLLKMLIGVEQPDRGEIRIVDSARIGYLPQDPQMDLAKTVLETYRYGQVGYEGEFVGRLIGYGLFSLEDMQKKVGQLSIGQRRKLEIARLMAEGPNVLLLDEPTNYISLDVLEAFEAAIVTFPGPVIAVSHDRWFMQRFGGRMWELVDGKIISD